MIYAFGSSRRDMADRAAVMGILNVTPDSFSDGGRWQDAETAVAHGMAMAADGAGFIDVGGESTRPGAEPVPPDEEARRVVPVIERLAARAGVPVSVDTRNASVAARALAAGALLVNDVSGLRHDPAMAGVIGRAGATAILMHMRGTPQTMQDDTRYGDLMGEILAYFHESIGMARAAGIRQIILDPGIGFGKTPAQNLEIIARLDELAAAGYPVMIGPSRKSFIGAVLGLPLDERLEGTIGASVVGVMRGAAIVRVHDVRPVVRAVRMAEAILHPARRPA